MRAQQVSRVSVRFVEVIINFFRRFCTRFFSLYSADELLLTELIFNGVFGQLSAQQSCALLSCFVFDEKSNEAPKLTEELSGPLRQMQVSLRFSLVYRLFLRRVAGEGLDKMACVSVLV